jgi:L-threonylcarbamoyladenylate synthase
MTAKPCARRYRGTPRNLKFLARKLQRGELVAVPSETVYGLAGNALDAMACRKIFTAKGRPSRDPLIVHIHSLKQLEQVAVPNAAALQLAQAFWPGPLTLILPKRAIVPDAVTAGLPSVAVRMPSHPLLRKLLRICQIPLAAPSANPFGYVSPTNADHVRDGLGLKIDYILDGGAAKIGIESTIVDLRQPGHPVLLRPGAITQTALQRVLKRRVFEKPAGSAPNGPQLAPGLLLRHYSPKTPVRLHKKLTLSQLVRETAAEAWLFIKKPGGNLPKNVFWLDEHGHLPSVAHRLFASLRKLDAAGFEQINVELAPGRGLAQAINDRLRRAAAK